MDADRVGILEHQMQTGKKFYDTWDYFLTHFAEKPGFMDASEPVVSEPLIDLLTLLLGQLYGKSLVAHIRLMSYMDGRMYHGTAFAGVQLVGFLYFPQANQGMLAIPDFGAKAMNQFVRFTVPGLQPGIERLPTPEG